MQIRDTVPAEVHRWSLVAAFAGTALLYGPRGGLDAGSAAKASALLVLAVLAVAVAAGAAVRDRHLVVPWHPAVAAAGLFGLAFVSRGLFSDAMALAFVGPIGRTNGIALYLGCIALFLVATARSDPRTWSFVINAAIVVGALVALFAIDEATVRLGPSWADRPGVAGTLGNANFLAGWSGVVLPIALAVVLDRRRKLVWRLGGAIVSLLLVVATWFSNSLQGGFVIAAGVGLLGLVFAYERVPRNVWWTLAGGVGTTGLLVGLLTVSGATGAGPLAALHGSVGVRLRAEYWAAAVRMWSEAPLTGVGPGQFIYRYRQVRSPEAASLVDLSSSTDSAHNVPLQFFAESGALVGSLYLVFLVTVVIALVQALRRTAGAERLWVGAFGAAWLVYVLQSLVSIDVPSLALVGWLLAGLIVGQVAGERHLGPVAPSSPDRGTRLQAAWHAAATGVVVVLVAVGMWAASYPYRADAAASTREVENRRTPDGRTATSPAIELAPWREAYRLQAVLILNRDGKQDRAEGVLRDLLERDPDSFDGLLNGARLARTMGDDQLALERYRRVLRREPLHPDLVIEVAEIERTAGDLDRARELIEFVLETHPDHPRAPELAARL